MNNDHIDNNDQLENNDNIMISLIDQEIVTAEDTIAVDLLHNFLISRKYSLGAVHILRQPKTGARRPPPLCQQMSAFG